MKTHPKLTHLSVTEDGQVYSRLSNKWLTLRTNKNGYIVLDITTDAGSKTVRAHRLVAETYLQEDPNYGLDVNHKDGVKTHNHKDNLEWCTRSHNISHAYDNNLNHSGEKHGNAYYTEEFIRDICTCLQDGWRNIDVASRFNVRKDFVSELRSGVTWKHVTKDYAFDVRRNSRASAKVVHRVCDLLSQGIAPVEVHRMIKSSSLSYKDVIRIRNGETWKSISKDYVIPISSKLSEDDAHKVCKALEAGESVRSIVERTRYTFDQVYKVRKRKSWIGVSQGYSF
jgi:hypothetical protein